jgi:nitric oxide reductase large subunit
MAGNDPTETGGLFIGRRPGTAPLRYRGTPTTGGPTRRRADALLAGGILVLETLLLTTLWGPQPAAWLWVGSQIFHETDSVSLGILVAFVGMLLTILVTLKAAMSLDRTWKLVRRASGHDQEKGALERIFVISMAIAGIAFFFWFLVIHGPGSDLSPTQG